MDQEPTTHHFSRPSKPTKNLHGSPIV
jgi:hypothetical protein